MRLYRAHVTLLVLLAACPEGPQPAVPDAAPPLATLEHGSAAELGLPYGGHAAVAVVYREDGRPRPGVAVGFTIVTDGVLEQAGGSSLSNGSVLTDTAGVAAVDVIAGAAEALFRVRATAPGLAPLDVVVRVSDAGFASLEVTPHHKGARPLGDFAVVDVRLYEARVCADIDPQAPPPSPGTARAVTVFGGAVHFPILLAGTAHAVLGRGRDAAGLTLAAACVDLLPAQVRAGQALALELVVADLDAALAGAYDLVSQLDLSPLRAAVLGDAWGAAGCPLGAAQLLLDCALDDLDGGDPRDCVVDSPGATAAALGQLRGAPGPTGCRPTLLGDGRTSIDARVMAALTPAGAPGALLDDAAAALADALGAVRLTSRLSPGGPAAAHRLLTASLGAAAFTVVLGETRRPILESQAVLARDGDRLSLGDHGFTLRLGDLAARALEARVFAPGGRTGVDPRTLASAVVAGATLAADTGCAAVSAAACAEALLTADCLADACEEAAVDLDARLATPFDRLAAPGLDLRLAGSAALGDEDGDLVAESLRGGLWYATALTDETVVAISGAFATE